MRERLRILLAGCFYYSGILKLAYWWQRRSGQRLIILNYHRAIGGNLRSQLLYLRRHYRIMHLEEALEELYTPLKDGRVLDQRIPLVLTFDDGYRDNYTHGFALARELQIPITVFLIPGYISSSIAFWWREGERLVHNAQVDKVTIEGRSYQLQQQEERRALVRTIDAYACHAGSVTEREAFLTDIRKALAVPSDLSDEEDALSLTWTQIHEMEESGWVSFGAHTMHHPILGYLADPTEVRQEVEECRRVLEQQLGRPVRTFAYPFGKIEHIGDEGLRAVKEARYKWALTTIAEINTPETDPHLLRRLPGDVNLHWLVMASELLGLLGILSRLKKKLKGKAMGLRQDKKIWMIMSAAGMLAPVLVIAWISILRTGFMTP